MSSTIPVGRNLELGSATLVGAHFAQTEILALNKYAQTYIPALNKYAQTYITALNKYAQKNIPMLKNMPKQKSPCRISTLISC